ncbi:MAG: hypothetical protein AAFN06_02030 [Pseudomonadota bacterium]
MRFLPVLLAAAMLWSPALAEKPATETKIAFEADTYRFGDLYRSERGTTTDACAQLCNQDRVCAAWTLTPATFQIGPRCELKRTPGAASHRPGAASGMSDFLQMDPTRHGEMRYQPPVPASRQPAAVPLDQLRPSPVPRIFGEPLPLSEPELLGAPEPKISAVMRPMPTVQAQPEPLPAPRPTPALVVVDTPEPVTPAPSAPTETVQVLRGPGEGIVPEYVKQPTPVEPHPLYKEPIRTAAPAAPETPKMVFKDPSLNAPAPAPTPTPAPVKVSSPLNAVERRQPAALPATHTPDLMTQEEAVTRIPPAPPASAINPIEVQSLPKRVPWTERDGMNPNYSVGSGFIPGDEDATAGFIEGAPEEVSEAGS